MRTPDRGDPAARSSLPRSGDVLHVTREASVQFATSIYFRVIRVHEWPTYTGWVWLDGYQLNATGDAVERRSIFVQAAGLRRVSGPLAGRPQRNGQGGPVRRSAPVRSRRPPGDR